MESIGSNTPGVHYMRTLETECGISINHIGVWRTSDLAQNDGNLTRLCPYWYEPIRANVLNAPASMR
ncbi:hypothetical protein VNO77_16020 [Canavalia gladiata]|uniref:Uncharacterized protein n=1 Tax=Canavalia gladiata TaxID=3824 RepID=A0AAN9M112_CANGL